MMPLRLQRMWWYICCRNVTICDWNLRIFRHFFLRKFRKQAVAKGWPTHRIDDYVEECEDCEGYAYWHTFFHDSGVPGALTDLSVYYRCREEDDDDWAQPV